MVKFKKEVSNSRVCNASPQWQKTYTIKGKQVKIWYSGDPAWKMTAEIPYGTSYEIGRFKANEPISQQEAEKLVKPVWGKMVRSARNSRVCNAYKQDNRDYLYHKASLLNSTDPVVRRALNAAVARNGWSPKQEKAVEKDLTAALSTIKAAATRIGLKGVSVSVDKYEHENVLIYSQNGETRGWRNIIDELYRALPRDYSLGLIRIAGPTVAIRVVPPCPNFMKVSE